MDLKAILEANKTKAGKTMSEQVIHKTDALHNQDRPYSIVDITLPSDSKRTIPQLEQTLSSFSDSDLNNNPVIAHTNGTQREHKWSATNTKDPEVIIVGKEIKQKWNTKRLQRDYKEEDTKGTQKGYSENKGDTKGTIKGLHKGLQRDYKNTAQNTDTKGTQRDYKYSHLRGWNKKIVDLIHEICRETVSKVTYPLTNNTISEMLNMPRHSVKTTMQRLKSKGLIIVTEFNDGRGGWSRYTLPEEFFNDIPQTERVLKGATKETQRGYKGDNKGDTQGDTNVSSSSSLSIKETTTTELSPEWGFNITPYARFGFTTTQLKQLASLNIISTMDVEQSLMEFSYDLDNNALPPIKTTKINFLMGLLRSGHSYVSEGFKNEQEAMIAEMAKRAEGKRKKLLEERFIAWEGGLMDEERKVIKDKLPLRLMSQYHAHGMGSEEVRSWLFNYYLQMEK